jgi:alkaline phosphatase D
MDRRLFDHLLTRRRLFGTGLSAATIAISRSGRPTRAANSHPPARLVTHPQFTGSPFTLGVASGDPLPDGVVLWTRLAPDAVNGGGMPPQPVEVRWEVATDDTFGAVVRSGAEVATPELAHCIHADVSGLEPAREYAYRFTAGDEVSPIGRTKTAPATDAPLAQLSFAAVSCAHYEHGYYTAYRHLAEEQLDFAVCLGDYIYEYGTDGVFGNGRDGPVRTVTGGETMTIADYRNRHALHKTDADLQAAHAAMPWIVTWDDHEVANNYAGSTSEDNEPVDAFLARRAAAYQAYYEHMPLRVDSMPRGPDALLYRRLTFGDLAEFNVLDTRQYRSPQPCGETGPRCDASYDPAVTLTGPEQEAWLFDGLAASGARWNVIAQQVVMAQVDAIPTDMGQFFNHDQWDGYPLARQRLIDQLQAAGTSNPIVLSGDVHSEWVNSLKLNFDDETSQSVGTEFVTTSITSHNALAPMLGYLRRVNPHIAYIDDHHGYTRCQITPDLWQTDFRAVDTVTDPVSGIETHASFVVENGRPGAVSR